LKLVFTLQELLQKVLDPFFCNMKIIEYAKISKIRCPRDIAPCDKPGN
jgi:hypothetical protein